MSTNLFSRLQALLPPSPLLIARVIEVHADDTSTVSLPINAGDTVLSPGLSQGRLLRVRGSQVPAGGNAFVRDGLIESRAPDGDPVLIVIGEVAPKPPTTKQLAVNGTIPAQYAAIGQPHRLLLPPFWKDGFAPNNYSFTGTLAAGLALSAQAGAVTGVPTTAGVFTMTPAATDGTARKVAQNAVAITVADDSTSVQNSLHLSFSGPTPVDHSGFAHPVSVIGAARITEEAARFFPSGLDLSAAGSGLAIPYHASLNLRDSIFTVEGWARNPSDSGYHALVEFRGSGGVGDSWVLFTDNFLQKLAVYDGPMNSSFLLTPNNSLPPVGEWFHWACERTADGLVKLYIAGVPLASATYNPPNTHASGIRIGVSHDGANSWGGALDETRIKKGVARYQGAFTPYSGPFAIIAPPVSPYWEPAGGTVWTLTNSDRTAQVVSGSGVRAVGCNVQRATGVSEKRYFEIVYVTSGSFGDGVRDEYGMSRSVAGNEPSVQGIGYRRTGSIRVEGLLVTSGSTLTANDVLGFAFDLSTRKVWVSLNGVWVGGGDPAAGTGEIGTLTAGTYQPHVSSESGSPCTVTLNAIVTHLASAPPTGFTAWGA